MTKIEIEAIRALPEEYVRDATEVVLVQGVPCALNPALLPMLYRGGKWDALNTSHSQVCEIICSAESKFETALVGDISLEHKARTLGINTQIATDQEYMDALDVICRTLDERARRGRVRLTARRT